DQWGPWGDWAACSRSCGGGITHRERPCLYLRDDGQPECFGSTRMYRTCNVQACPEGSRPFRNVQCSEFDEVPFEGRTYKWVPYHGGTKRCELNCMPKGENFYFRHALAVIDGTPCELGKSDKCVEGICMLISQEENKGIHYEYFMPAKRNRAQLGYGWSHGSWGSCGKECSGGLPGFQTRTVYCSSAAAAAPADESACLASLGPAPASRQSCSLQPCPQWIIGSWEPCSATCGTGVQTRAVTCGPPAPRGAQLARCSPASTPPARQPCERAACPARSFGWFEGPWGLCSVSCGGGLRKRQALCYNEDFEVMDPRMCGEEGHPTEEEGCNTQPCYLPQEVPSQPNPLGFDSTQHRVYSLQERPERVDQRPERVDQRPERVDCAGSYYGCCPDGRNPAHGHRGEGCPDVSCYQTR
uniref:Papilin a, proteoglycan-like sulfated glycoprotein n=1 Tax=Petromyzon marinus TaxID=7757 RepID=S4RGB2_PETMA